MKLTIHFPDKVGEQILGIPDRDAFVSDLVAKGLEHRSKSASVSRSSKWAEIVRRVRRDPAQLGEYYPRLREEMREFREKNRNCPVDSWS